MIKLIKGYFNSFNLKLENKLRKERLRNKFRKLSTNKIFLSNGEFKHTNDKVSITLYIYNRQKYNYLYKLKNKYISLFSKTRFLIKLNLIKSIGSNILKKQTEKKNILDNILPSYKSRVSLAQHLYYKRFLKNSLNKLKYYMFHKQLIYINQNKYTLSYIQGLIYLLKKIYNKNIEFNLVNLKYFYFNSDIFSQPLVLKLRRKRKVLYYLKSFVRKVNINRVKVNLKSNNYYFDLQKIYKIKNVDVLNNLLLKLLKQNKRNFRFEFNKSCYLKKLIFSFIKYKRVSGVRLEASGRLTKRYTASRSLHKVMYRGNLKNTLSSIKGYSSVVLRGNSRPNLEYTKVNSKARIGSFGIKG